MARVAAVRADLKISVRSTGLVMRLPEVRLERHDAQGKTVRAVRPVQFQKGPNSWKTWTGCGVRTRVSRTSRQADHASYLHAADRANILPALEKHGPAHGGYPPALWRSWVRGLDSCWP